tara:strand:- start:2905 stop:5616 length:2712 start_codon:yes stop_codon:yes gene_type:complete
LFIFAATPTPVGVALTPAPEVVSGLVVSDLSISPSIVGAGVPVSVQFSIKNEGSVEVEYVVYITVDGGVEKAVKGTLAGGGSTTIIETISRATAGTHIVAVGDLVDSFTVEAARMVLSDLSVSPINVGPGDTVFISAQVTNSGGSAGIYLFDLFVAGQLEKRFNGILPVNQSKKLVWKTSRDDPGGYQVSLGALTDGFEVLAPVVDVEITKELTISELTTTAVDEDGNTLALTGDKVEIVETESGDIAIDLPIALATGKKLTSFTDSASGISLVGNKLTIPIKNAQGEELLRIVAEVTSTDGTGDKAQAALKKDSVKLEVPEKTADLSADDPRVGKVAVSISAGLNKIPDKAKITVVTKKTVDSITHGGFELLARGRSETIADIGAAIEITRENLVNGTDIGEVTLSLAVGSAWVEANGGTEKVQMARRADDGSQEFLPTTYKGTDSEGRMIFEAVSANGFSIFALVALADKVADIVVESISVKPQAVAPGEAIEITAQVANNGNASGSTSLVLEINGAAEEVKNVTLNAGAKTSVTFTTLRNEEGRYTVSLEGKSSYFEVAIPLTTDLLNVANLRVNPISLDLGGIVTIAVTALNSGSEKGKFDVQLKLNGAVVDTGSVLLGAGASSDVTFSYKPTTVGSYEVDILGLKSKFEVRRALTPAKFGYGGLVITPVKIQPGGEVTISIDVANSGGQSGSVKVGLRINGIEEEAKNVKVAGLSSEPVKFLVIRNEPGVYMVQAGDKQGTFEVLRPPLTKLGVTLAVDDKEVEPGGPIKVIATVTNPNSYEVAKELMLTVDGNVIETKNVVLAAGETKSFTFDVQLGGPGKYILQFEGAKAEVEVAESGEVEVTQTDEVVTMKEEESAPADESSNTVIIIVGVVALLAIGGVAAYFVLGRRKEEPGA